MLPEGTLVTDSVDFVLGAAEAHNRWRQLDGQVQLNIGAWFTTRPTASGA